MIIGTAGHIDHGKTSLVKALTGTDGDRLAEEKARGITIELGFAYADLGSGRPMGFVDVPGHEKLIHTMLAGAGGIDAALVVVAADDGIMPQTREHLAILDLLGITKGVIALTKSDLADPARLAEVEAEIREALALTGLKDAPILPVSVVTGAGVPALRDWLLEAESATHSRNLDGAFRLAVDRSFTLSGAGTVVTGTVLSGEIAVGDQVMISPLGLPARVRAIHAQNRKAERGRAGERCALNLAGDGVTKEAIHRGDMIIAPELHRPSDRIDAELLVLPSEPKALTTWFPARLHSHAVEVGARIVPLDDTLAPGQSGRVQLVLDRPIAATIGDRFILRDTSASRTIGGGQFLDLRAPARKRRTPERLAILAAQAIPDNAKALTALAEPAPVDLAAFLRDRGLPAATAEALRQAAGLAPLGEMVIAPAMLEGLRAQMTERLEAFHAENPDLAGLGREKLRLDLNPRLPKPVFLTYLRQMADAGALVLDGAFLRLPGHEVQLSPEDEALFQQIYPQLLGEARFRPPRVRDFATALGVDEREVRKLMRLTQKLGRIDQIAHDHFFARSTTQEMVAILLDVAGQTEDGWFTAPQFRDRVNNGRKVAIEILDFFDRNGLTLRRGDMRRINPHRADLFGL